jgi:uncharacterized protein YneR
MNLKQDKCKKYNIMITKFKKFETKEIDLNQKYSDITSYIEEKIYRFFKNKKRNKYTQISIL